MHWTSVKFYEIGINKELSHDHLYKKIAKTVTVFSIRNQVFNSAWLKSDLFDWLLFFEKLFVDYWKLFCCDDFKGDHGKDDLTPQNIEYGYKITEYR